MNEPIKLEATNDFFVVRTPWHSLIVHRVVKGVLIGDYHIEAGPFPDHFAANAELVRLLTNSEDAEQNARKSEIHSAYPSVDMPGYNDPDYKNPLNYEKPEEPHGT